MNNVTKVKVGLTTIIGYLTGIGAEIPILIKSIEEGRVALEGPEKWLALYGVVTVGITQLIRGWQAKEKVRAHGAVEASTNDASYEGTE